MQSPTRPKIRKHLGDFVEAQKFTDDVIRSRGIVETYVLGKKVKFRQIGYRGDGVRDNYNEKY